MSSDPPETPAAQPIPTGIQAEFRRINSSLTGKPVAFQVWDEVLTANERERLGGDLKAAFTHHQGIVPLFMAVRQISFPRALVELASELGWLSDSAKRRLERFISDPVITDLAPPKLKPNWDGHGQLSYNGRVIRKVRGPDVTPNIWTILDAFEKQNWPPRILDPLDGPKDGERLRKVIASLNRGLSVIRFRADGSGSGLRWDFA